MARLAQLVEAMAPETIQYQFESDTGHAGGLRFAPVGAEQSSTGRFAPQQAEETSEDPLMCGFDFHRLYAKKQKGSTKK